MALAVRAAAAAAAADRLRRRSLDRRKLLLAHPGGHGRPGARPGPAHRHRTGAALACLRVRLPTGLRRLPSTRPARQTFVSELVARSDLTNAVALNSTSFNAARMIGPGHGRGADRRDRLRLGVPDQRGVSFAAVLGSLCLLRVARPASEASSATPRQRARRRLPLVWRRPDLQAILLMLFLVGTFGLNFPDLHLHHVGHGVSRRRGPVRTADLHHGGRVGRRRPAGRARRTGRASPC